jgi:hypothetical protein
VICFLDGPEEARMLFNPEVNLRLLIKRQLKKLLHQKISTREIDSRQAM